MKFVKLQIARQFSRAASTYDEVAQLQCEMANRMIEQIPIGQAGTLVDFGCGTGYALEQIPRFSDLKLHGIDIAPGMIEHAKKRLPHAMLELGDLEQTELAANSIDIAFSNAAIQWCEASAAFAEMARVLKPGGLLLVSTFGPGTLDQWKDAWHEIGDNRPRVHELASRESLRVALNSAGFLEPEIIQENRTLQFNSVRSMFQSIKKLGATNASPGRPVGLLGREQFSKLFTVFEKRLEQQGFINIGFECIFITSRLSRKERAGFLE